LGRRFEMEAFAAFVVMAYFGCTFTASFASSSVNTALGLALATHSFDFSSTLVQRLA
jgi:hypothetical protein